MTISFKTDKFLGFDFNRNGWVGDTKNEAWLQFVRAFRSDLKAMLKGTGWTVYNLSPNWFEVSGFLYHERLDKWMYFGTSDVRYFQDEWSKSMLIRTAKGARDYTGGMNHFIEFKNIPDFLQR